MKKLLIASILCLAMAAPAAFGRALITKGSNELALGGMIDPSTALGTSVDLSISYGYFFWDYISLGPMASFSDNDAGTFASFGLSSDLNFPISDDYQPLIGTDFVPYIGLGLGYQYCDVPRKDASAAVLSLEGGVKFFLSDTAAVTAAVVGYYATDEVFPDDDNAHAADVNVRLGMRFYF